MRHLASVQQIDALEPIPGKDRIVLATVLGWRVIVQKADYNVGDQCVYIEIDSVLPEKPEFEFLRSKNFRIKTMKMAGVISQGICFPMSILPTDQYTLGQDVTDLIGVKQYEPEMDDPVQQTNSNSGKLDKFPKFLRKQAWFRKLILCQKKKSKEAFPSFISKTDETRIQSAPWLLMDPTPYTFTEKIDGTSGTFALVKHKRLFRTTYEYIVCSRNRRLPVDDGSIYWRVSEKYRIKDKLINLIGDRAWVAIQGECIGPKIQGNKYNVQEPFLYVFNLLTPDGRTPSLKAKGILSCYDLDFVPIVKEQTKLPSTVEDMLALAHGESALAHTLREGLVCRSVDGKQSFKAVDPEFLLKYASN